MSYELRLPPDTRNEIREFLERHYDDPSARFRAAGEIQHELEKLAANPKLGATPPGPFERRPIYRFAVVVGDDNCLVQVTYKINEVPPYIVIAGFVEV